MITMLVTDDRRNKLIADNAVKNMNDKVLLLSDRRRASIQPTKYHHGYGRGCGIDWNISRRHEKRGISKI